MTPNWKRDVFTGANKRLQPSAVAAFNKALRAGGLVRQPCVICGEPKSHGHHEDYARPLDVVWLCAIHHRWRHTYGETVENMLALREAA